MKIRNKSDSIYTWLWLGLGDSTLSALSFNQHTTIDWRSTIKSIRRATERTFRLHLICSLIVSAAILIALVTVDLQNGGNFFNLGSTILTGIIVLLASFMFLGYPFTMYFYRLLKNDLSQEDLAKVEEAKKTDWKQSRIFIYAMLALLIIAIILVASHYLAP